MIPIKNSIAETIRLELKSTHSSFHTLLETLTEEDMNKRSLNPGWTNGEILAHMLFGFIILDVLLPMAQVWGRLPKGSSKPFSSLLDAFVRPFNWINAIGARMQGHVFTYKRIGKIYDRVYASLLKKINSIKDDEWEKGMYYPTKWDSNFSEFMTLEKLFRYPMIHFKFHQNQISH